MMDTNEIFSIALESPLGKIWISGTDEFINEISFSDDTSEKETVDFMPEVILQCKKELDLFFKGELRTFTVKVLQDGTVFQKRIWQELETIPFGKTSSYLDLAKKTGDFNNTRAIGNANGKNNIAIVIPCHRVIGHDGSLTGYSGGLWRKEWLLKHEAKVAHGVLELF